MKRVLFEFRGKRNHAFLELYFMKQDMNTSFITICNLAFNARLNSLGWNQSYRILVITYL